MEWDFSLWLWFRLSKVWSRMNGDGMVAKGHILHGILDKKHGPVINCANRGALAITFHGTPTSKY
jgi:hypothetical protein